MKSNGNELKKICHEFLTENSEKVIDFRKMAQCVESFKKERIRQLQKSLGYHFLDLLETEIKYFFSHPVLRLVRIISLRAFVRMLTQHIVIVFKKYKINSDAEKISALLTILKVRSAQKTYGHVLRLAYLVEMGMKKEFGHLYTKELSDIIIQNCLIHDIGKIFWPESYFVQACSYQMWNIKRHVLDGVFLCNALGIDEKFCFVLKTHQYSNDGSPRAYKVFADEITDSTRVLWQISSLMDTFDAAIFRGETKRRKKESCIFGRVDMQFVIGGFLDKAVEINIEPRILLPLFDFMKKELLIVPTVQKT